MEYYAIYTRTPGRPRPGGKVMVVHHGIHSLLDVLEDDEGMYFAQEDRRISIAAIDVKNVYPVELSLCTQDIKEGDKCIVRHYYREEQVVESITPTQVIFKTGTPKAFSRLDTFRVLATISEKVNFLKNGEVVPSAYVSFMVVSQNRDVQSREISSPNDVTLKKTERIVALITCSKCGQRL